MYGTAARDPCFRSEKCTFFELTGTQLFTSKHGNLPQLCVEEFKEALGLGWYETGLG
jgi:hypothetical protein